MTLPKSVLVIFSFQFRVRNVHRAIVSWAFWRQPGDKILCCRTSFDFALTFSVKCLVGYVKLNVDKRRERVGLETFNNLYVRRFDTSSDVYTSSSKWFDDDFVQTNFCYLQSGD